MRELAPMSALAPGEHDISITMLRTLAEIVEHGNRKAAAECLGISQRAVQANLKELYLRMGFEAENGIHRVLHACKTLGWLRSPAHLITETEPYKRRSEPTYIVKGYEDPARPSSRTAVRYGLAQRVAERPGTR